MVVYLDLVFLLNFLIDGATLLSTAWTRKQRVRWLHIAAAALIGAAYVLMMALPPLSFLFTFFAKCLFSALMIYTAFGFGSLQHFLRNLGIFYLINFVAAGAIYGVHYFLLSSGEAINGIWLVRLGGSADTGGVGLLSVAVVFIGALVLYRIVFGGAKEREALSGYFAEIRVRIDRFEIGCVGLIDTGNQLRDPLTRTPIMVMEAARLRDKLPDSWLDRIRDAQVEQMIADASLESFEWQDRLRLVPYRGVNRKTGFMLAIKPDQVVITHQSRRIEPDKVWIGLDGGRLSSDNSYQAIIHPVLMEAK